MHSSILKNLIEYQRQTAQATGLEVLSHYGLSSVLNATGSWPRSTIGTTVEQHFPDVAEHMDSGHMAPFWIMDNEVSEQQIRFVEGNGFKEVNRWEGMLLKKGAQVVLEARTDEFRVEPVCAETIQDWYAIVKEVMLPAKSISTEILDFWVASKSVNLLLGKVQEKHAAAGMSFTQGKTAGLYFIATLSGFRGKGYATVLVNELIRKCFQDGANEVVLHASEMGSSIYRKMGFSNEGLISTYWKVGRF